MYKPGDKVNFRVLVLDLNLKPGTIRGDMKVFISVSTHDSIFHLSLKEMLMCRPFDFIIYRTAQTIELNSG